VPATIPQSLPADASVSLAADESSISVTVEVSEGFDGLAALRSDWNELFRARSNEPSTSFEWTFAMVRHHVRAGDRPFLLSLKSRGRLVGLVPLLARTFRLFGCDVVLLAPLSEDYNTHSDLLLRHDSPEVVRAFVAALFRLNVSWDCFRMARLLEGSPVATLLERCLAEAGRSHLIRDGLPAYELPLPRSFDGYLAGRSSKFRNHLKRFERRLEAAGRIAVHEVTDAHQLDVAYEAVLAIERSSWKHRHGTGITAVPRQLAFYREFAREALAAGRLHLQWLALNDRPVAYNFGFLHDARYHYLKTSYDARYRQLSPATYLRARLIERLIEQRVAHFDFPGEPYAWEAQWTGAIRWRKVLTLYAPTLRGRALALADRLRHPANAERTVRHLNPWAKMPSHHRQQ
jgi:CelD/BcsL family acetyltransferase involved in cellulose biosynthesis